jgi:outer membrane protein assembly factor BamB
MKRSILLITIGASLIAGGTSVLAQASVQGWLNWRGPHQNGVSDETCLPDEVEVGGKNHLWTYKIAGRGTPVVANGRVYAFGYRGEGPDLQEYLSCLSEETGELIWEKGFSDFLSDTVYDRYSVGSPAVDAETGRIYLGTTNGVILCFSPDGEILWEHSLMERFGRLTFPNGRTGAPVIDQDLVIIRGITSYWGADGPARDRFYAFDKISGELVWSSTPGVGPKDSSFSTPVFGWANGKRVFYAGTGCGNVVCINARTGDPIWRFQFSYGGVNSSVLLHNNDKIIAIHGKENIDSSEVGRMAAIRIGKEPAAGEKGPLVLGKSDELWRNPLTMFTSSPVLVGDRVYQITHTGDLVCVDVNSGAILWSEKLNNSQIHASPLYADGKLYVPMISGDFYILKVKEDGVEILDKEPLGDECLGSPSLYNGKIYVHTKGQLFCFGSGSGTPVPAKPEDPALWAATGPATQLQVIPNDLLLAPGESAQLRVRKLDANGFVVEEMTDVSKVNFSKFIPPTAKVRTEMDASFSSNGEIYTTDCAKTSAGAFKASVDGLSGIFRGRALPAVSFSEGFDDNELLEERPNGVAFDYPPLPWIGARFKWEVQSLEGNNVLTKTLDNVLFQRAITFFGDPEASNYTVEADVMTDGNRRTMSNVGVINQRYFINLIGNWQELEISSNHERVKVSVPFRWKAKTWYRLKTRVDIAEDGSGVVRAKAWERGTEEPDAWTIEAEHKNAHKKGAPGLIGFSPQSRFSVYVDNISVTPNE